MSKPKMSGFQIVGEHSESPLCHRVQFVEQMRIYPDPGGHSEIARIILSREILKNNSPSRQPPRLRSESGAGSSVRQTVECEGHEPMHWRYPAE